MDSIGIASTLRNRLATHKGRWPKIAEVSGVPISTLRKIAQGATPNPRVETVDRLLKALDAHDAGSAVQ